jgi:hypothetical protein
MEQVVAVLRTGRGFGVVLHGEDGLALQRDAGVGAVEQRDVGFDHASGRLSRSTAKPWFIETISTLPVVKSFTGWLAPWWP